jgi:lipopolysaccharide export system protein LptA
MKVKKQIRDLVLFALLGWAPLSAWALASDRDKPLEIEADNAELDDAVRVAVYRGKVVATQGSMRLTGDVLTVRYTPEKDLQEVLVDGKPATFKQKPDKGTIDDKGEATRMEYHALDKLLYLINNAKVEQQNQVYTGQRMVYDTERSIVTMKGDGPRNAPDGKPASSTGRIKIVIPPKNAPKP